eukprot:3366077-Prymnesium_polylepis.1
MPRLFGGVGATLKKRPHLGRVAGAADGDVVGAVDARQQDGDHARPAARWHGCGLRAKLDADLHAVPRVGLRPGAVCGEALHLCRHRAACRTWRAHHCQVQGGHLSVRGGEPGLAEAARARAAQGAAPRRHAQAVDRLALAQRVQVGPRRRVDVVGVGRPR